MREGQISTSQGSCDRQVTIEGDGERHYRLGPAQPHDDHGVLKIGDGLVAATDSTANGDALVTMPCGCARLLFAS